MKEEVASGPVGLLTAVSPKSGKLVESVQDLVDLYLEEADEDGLLL
jgi:hypothetical protein